MSSSLDHVRALLRDRKVKPGALGSTKQTVCLDLSLVDAVEAQKSLLDDLAAERRAMVASSSTSDRRAGGIAATPDTADVDRRILDAEAAQDAAKQAMRAASITMTFRSLGSDDYSAVVNSFDDPDGSDRQALLDALCEQGLVSVITIADGEKVDGLTWAEIAPALSPGEREVTNVKILAVNKRTVDVPLS